MNKKGFTLMEMLVVVLIIGILTRIAIPQYLRAVEKSRVAEPKMVLRVLEKAIYRYYLATNNCPTKITDLDIEMPGILNTGGDQVKSTHFIYLLSGAVNNGSGPGSNCGVPLAQRISPEYYYWDAHSSNAGYKPIDGFSCWSDNDAGKAVCEAVGALSDFDPW